MKHRLFTLLLALVAYTAGARAAATQDEVDALFANLDFETVSLNAWGWGSSNTPTGWTLNTSPSVIDWGNSISSDYSISEYPTSGGFATSSNVLFYCVGKTGTLSADSNVLYQTASTAPAGTYTVTARVYNQGFGSLLKVFAASSSETSSTTVTATTAGTWSATVTLEEEGKLTIGLMLAAGSVSSSGTICFWVDDFAVTYEAPADEEASTETETVSISAFENLDFESCALDDDNEYVSEVTNWTLDWSGITNNAYSGNYCSLWAETKSVWESANIEGLMLKFWLNSASSITANAKFAYTSSSEELPAGTYTVSAYVHSSSDAIALFASDGTQTITTNAVGTTTWDVADQLTLKITLTEASTLTIGLMSTAALATEVNVYADNFAVSAKECSMTEVVSSEGYATYISSYAYALPEGVTGYSVDTVADGVASLTAAYTNCAIVPANTPLLFKGDMGETYTYYAITEEVDATEITTLLQGSVAEVVTSGGAYYYALSYDSDGKNIGFYYMADDGAAFTSEAGKCWLALPESTGAAQRGFAIANGGDDTTGIAILTPATTSDAIYTLAGQRVSNATKGLYIIGGKKVVK